MVSSGHHTSGHHNSIPVLADTNGMTAVVAAVDALEGDPFPVDSFRWGDMYRLRVGPYRIMYVVEGDLITVDRVDRIALMPSRKLQAPELGLLTCDHLVPFQRRITVAASEHMELA